MSEDYYIPFEIQSDIIKRLPVKSVVQFRSVSRQWKSFIDSPEIIQKYHVNRTNPQHHLLFRYNLDRVPTYTSIIDDITFPLQKFPITAPEPLKSLRLVKLLGSVDGLVCFYGWHKYLQTHMVVIWNPSVRKCVGIPIPNVLASPYAYTRIGFGVCPDTNDPKLVKINVVETPTISWEVQVFTLSSRVWKTVYMGAPFTTSNLMWDTVVIDGIIYWLTRCGFIISFNLNNEEFGKVCLPKRISHVLKVVKVNESLGFIEFYGEGWMSVCGVWIRKDGANRPFTNIYTVKVKGERKVMLGSNVLGFKNNGDILLGFLGDDIKTSSVEVYEPSSGHISGVGIKGEYGTFSASSYMETLLLLDQPNSIIYC